ncbi:MAG: segregation/condensation protein A [Chitinophagales bacterium]|nr:segregation/condensation protein A [Chitinophagales bacterium]
MTTEAPVTYEIKLPQFEGPFDLLLFFIERDELDVYDIPIAKITSEFLNYLHQASVMNMDLASEFIVVAATLMRIKAKLLLPRKEIDEAGNEIDPRQELVQQLLEYKRYKDVLDELKLLEDERSKMFVRGNVESELEAVAKTWTGEAELHTLTMFKLLKAYERAMQKAEEQKNRPVHKIANYPYTIEGQKEFLTRLIESEKDIPFTRIFEACENRIHAVFTFLAMLEMIAQQSISLQVGMGVNNFWINRVAA